MEIKANWLLMEIKVKVYCYIHALYDYSIIA